MKTRTISLLLALLTTSLAQAEDSRTFCGRPLGGWIEALNSRSSTEVREAIRILRYYGPGAAAAVPKLIVMLKARTHEDDVIETLGRIGPSAAPAVPLLVERFKGLPGNLGRFGGSAYGNVTFALQRIGRPAVPALITLLSDPDVGLRVRAAEILDGIGPEAKEAVPALIKILQSQDADDSTARLQRHAVSALSQIGPEARAAIPKVSKLLEREQKAGVNSLDDGLELARALARIGGRPDQILPELPHWKFCYRLGKLGPLARSATALLQKELNDPRLDVRSEAAAALAHIDPTFEAAIPPLIEALRASSDGESLFIDAIAEFGPKAHAAAPLLIQRLLAKPDSTKLFLPLVAIDPEGKLCVPSLVAGLKQDEDSMAMAAESLSLIGPKARDALPALRSILIRSFNDPSSQLPTEDALKAVCRIDPESRETLAFLCQALQHKRVIPTSDQGTDKEAKPSFDDSAAATAAQILGSYGHNAKSAVPSLMEALQDATKSSLRDDFGLSVAFALSRIGPDAAPAIPLLKSIAGDCLTSVRTSSIDVPATIRLDVAAAIALISIDPESRERVKASIPYSWHPETLALLFGALGQPSLEAEFILRDECYETDQAVLQWEGEIELPEGLEPCIQHLARFGFASRPVIPKLKAWLQHPNPWIRLWAREALTQIP